MAKASLHPSSDGARFEVHSRVSTSVPKMIVKSAHRAEIARWVQAIKLNIEYFDGSDSIKQSRSELKVKTQVNARNLGMSPEKPIASAIKAMPPTDSFLSPELKRTATGLSSLSLQSIPHDANGADEGAETLSLYEAAEKDSIAESIREQPRPPSYGLPHEATFDLGVLNIKAQIELTQQLVDSIVTPPGSPEKDGAVPMARTNSRQQAVKEALRSSLQTLATQVSSQSIMTQNREQYLLGRIQRELEARKVWEENMLAVAEQQAETDRQLNEAARDNEKKRKALRKARGVLAGLSAGDGSAPSSPAPPESTATSSAFPGMELASTPSIDGRMPRSPMPRESSSNMNQITEAHDEVAAAAGDDSDDDDEEFFDAVEQNNMPNLQLHDSIARPGMSRPVEDTAKPAPVGTIKALLGRQSLEPYAHVRHKLPIDDDMRPSVSCTSLITFINDHIHQFTGLMNK